MSENVIENEDYEYRKGDAVLIPALARGESMKEAARLAGMVERTAARRFADPKFRREVWRIQSDIVERSVALISDTAADAITKLKDLLKAESETVQLGAARALVDYSIKLRDASQIERLKAQVEELIALWKQSQGGNA